MRYISTRHGSQGTPAPLGFEDVMLAGLARDGGLYLPEAWPHFSTAEIAALRDKPYAEVAYRVMRPFVGDAFDEPTFRRLIAEAYASFETPDVAPLKPLGDSGLHLLELFHGPTLAFKDVALQLLGRMLDAKLVERHRHATIVGATSGDTGSAAIEAVRDRKTIDIFMLYPHGRVSEVQRRQMTTVLAPNVHNIAVAGTFDDCQDLAKACFNDLAFRDRHCADRGELDQLRARDGADRLLLLGALKLGAPERPVAFTVPTGNFGNVYARLRRPAHGPADLAFRRGRQQQRHPGALLRDRRHDHDGRDADAQPQHGHPDLEQLRAPAVRPLRPRRQGAGRGDGRFRSTGTLEVGANALGGVRELFDAGRVDDEGTLAAIADCHRRFGETIDPHTAVGYAVAQQHRRDPAIPMVVLATAHPAKFPDAVQRATGERPALPARLGDMMNRVERVEGLPNDVAALKALIDDRTSAANPVQKAMAR